MNAKRKVRPLDMSKVPICKYCHRIVSDRTKLMIFDGDVVVAVRHDRCKPVTTKG